MSIKIKTEFADPKINKLVTRLVVGLATTKSAANYICDQFVECGFKVQPELKDGLVYEYDHYDGSYGQVVRHLVPINNGSANLMIDEKDFGGKGCWDRNTMMIKLEFGKIRPTGTHYRAFLRAKYSCNIAQVMINYLELINPALQKT